MNCRHLIKPLTILFILGCLVSLALALGNGEDPAAPEYEYGNLASVALGENTSIASGDGTDATPLLLDMVPEEIGSRGDPYAEWGSMAGYYQEGIPLPLSETILWDYALGESISSTSLSADGTSAIVGTERPGKLFYFNAVDGSLKWTSDIGVPVGGVSISPDATYIAAAADKLYLLYPHGGEVWSKNTGYFACSVALSSRADLVAAGFDDGSLQVFNQYGDLQWMYQAEGDVISVATTDDGSYIAAGSDDHTLYFFDRTGSLLWSYPTGGRVESVSVSPSGEYIAAGSGDRVVYFFNTKGDLLWKFDAENRITGVSLSSDGAFVAVGEGCSLHLFDRKGNETWKKDTADLGERVTATSLGTLIGVDVTAVTLSRQGDLTLVAGTGTGDQKVYCFALRPNRDSDGGVQIKQSPSLTDIQQVYLHTAGEDQDIESYAFISSIAKQSPEEDSRLVVRMEVSPEGVERLNGTEAVHITEWIGDAAPKVLGTKFVGYDLNNNYLFEALSTEGSSKFGLRSALPEGEATPVKEPVKTLNLTNRIFELV